MPVPNHPEMAEVVGKREHEVLRRAVLADEEIALPERTGRMVVGEERQNAGIDDLHLDSPPFGRAYRDAIYFTLKSLLIAMLGPPSELRQVDSARGGTLPLAPRRAGAIVKPTGNAEPSAGPICRTARCETSPRWPASCAPTRAPELAEEARCHPRRS